jgi:hypothetical protein
MEPKSYYFVYKKRSRTWARLTQSIRSHSVSSRSTLMLLLDLPSGLFYSGVARKILYAFLVSFVHTLSLFPTYVVILYLILTEFGEEHKSCAFTSYNIVHFSISSKYSPKQPVIIIPSFSVFPFGSSIKFHVRIKRDKIIFFNTLIFKFLERKWSSA